MAKRTAAQGSTTAGSSGSKGKARPLGPECRIVLLVGAEEYLCIGYTDQLRNAITATGVQVDTVRFDGQSATVADVLDECRSYGLLAGHKLVVVDHADEFVKEQDEEEAPAPPPANARRGAPRSFTRRQLLERYAESPSPDATLILRSESWRPGKIDKLIEQVGCIVACDPLEEGRCKAWVVARTRRQQRQIDPDAVEALYAITGGSLGRLAAELDKLAAAAGPDGLITLELVESLVAAAPIEQKPWVLGEHLVSGDPERALTKLREMLDRSRIDPVPLRWACADLAAKIFGVSAGLKAGASVSELSKRYRLWGPQASAVTNIARRTPPAQAAELLARCVEADYRGKTGQGDPEIELEILVCRIADLCRG